MNENKLLDNLWNFIITPYLYGIQQSDNLVFLEHTEN